MRKIKVRDLRVGMVMTGRCDVYGEPLRDREVVRAEHGRWSVVGLTGVDPEWPDTYGPNDEVWIADVDS